MISLSTDEPTGSLNLVAQVEEIFSPAGILSRASNFEYRPQQQQMAVAVARGAAYYGMVRRGAGVRIAASLARSYYIGFETQTSAEGSPPSA